MPDLLTHNSDPAPNTEQCCWCIFRWTDGCVGGWTDERVDGSVDGWVGGWMDVIFDIPSFPSSTLPVCLGLRSFSGCRTLGMQKSGRTRANTLCLTTV